MRKFRKIAVLAVAALFFVTTWAIAGGTAATVTSIKGSTVIVTDGAGKRHSLQVAPDQAASLKAGDKVLVDEKGKVMPAK